MGARARAMGGGYTAFEDDPLSVWFNPAGIANQPGGVSLAYQTFSVYEGSESARPPERAPSKVVAGGPEGVPAQLGAVYQIGTAERPQALGLCFVSPLFLKMAFDAPDDIVSPNTLATEQTFYRIRLAYARDFRFSPVGEEGWLLHLAVGVGADVGITTFDMTDLSRGGTSGDTKIDYGGGLGLLLGLFDNTRNLKVNVGVAYQSAIDFDLVNVDTRTPPRPGPAFNWPEQIQLGVLFFLLEGLPLRVTTELQIVGWRGAIPKSEVPGASSFSRTTSVSVGAEYRITVDESTALFPRLGLRLYDAPWDSNTSARLPATGDWQLYISTRDDRFLVFSMGFGVSFATGSGVATSVDVAFEIGGESPAASLGIVVGF